MLTNKIQKSCSNLLIRLAQISVLGPNGYEVQHKICVFINTLFKRKTEASLYIFVRIGLKDCGWWNDRL
jgi:hypothetical protein